MARTQRQAGVVAMCAALAAAMPLLLPMEVAAEQGSQPGSAAAAKLDVGRHHSCAVLPNGSVRCWGYGAQGQLGYANTSAIGDDESPRSVATVDLGPSRTATAISAGDFHTCALLDDGSVRCWGYGADGRLGYAATQNVGDNETPGSVGPVGLGQGRTATAISAGLGHTCALLDDGNVRCWGYGENGALGYAATASIGDDERPGSTGPVDLGAGRTARAITAGGDFTCALLDDGSVRCWGLGLDGRLGYGNTARVGDDETPGSAGPVDLGEGRTATAVSAGARAACAILDNAAVRCWGEGREGTLGYGDGKYVGDNETPGSVGPVDLGQRRTATAVSVGRHSCAVLDVGSARCWGPSTNGQLGYGNTARIGDDETPGSAGPVDLGPGRTVVAVSAGELHTCARLEDDSVRCWGYGANGRLGLCAEHDIGDDEVPGSVAPVDMGLPGITGAGCPGTPPADAGAPALSPGAPAAPLLPSRPDAPDRFAAGVAAERARAQALRGCLRAATRKLARERLLVRRRGPSAGRSMLRQAARRARLRRAACLRRHARSPGRVIRLRAQPAGRRRIRLAFEAVGSDGRRPPAARHYLIKQSRRPIRTARDFARAPALCAGTCSFEVTRVGSAITLTITDLHRHRRYYYVIAARDNVSGRIGPRSKMTTARAR